MGDDLSVRAAASRDIFAPEPPVLAPFDLGLPRATIPRGCPIRSILEDLYSPDAACRARAAVQLHYEKNWSLTAIPFLLALLPDGTRVWQTWMGSHSPSTPGAEAALALRCIGGPAVQPLITALRNGPWRARMYAAKSLGEMGMIDQDEFDVWPGAKLRSYLINPTPTQLQKAVPPLVTALGDQIPLVREQAAFALGESHNHLAVAPLLGALHDPCPAVREKAAMGLGILRARSAVPALIAILNDPAPDARRGAAWALGPLQDRRAVAPLLALSSERDLQVWCAVASSLSWLGGPETVDFFLAGLKEPLGYGVQASAPALGRLHDPRAVQPLIDQLHRDLPSWALVDVIEALSQLGDARAIEPLLSMLDDPSPGVRQAAAKALFPFRDPRVIPPLLREIADRRIDASEDAILTVGHVHTEEAFLALLALLRSNDFSMSLGAARALGDFGDVRAVEPLIGAMRFDRYHINLAAVEALGKLGDRRAVEPLIAALADKDFAGVRTAVLEALGTLGDPRALGPVVAALPVCGDQAVSVLSQLGAPVAFEAVVGLLQDPKQPATVRSRAATVLGEWGDRRAVEPLLARLEQTGATDWSVPYALGILGDRRAVPALIAVLKREPHTKDARAHAADALGKIGDRRAVEPLLRELNRNTEAAPSAAYALGSLRDWRAVDPLIARLRGDTALSWCAARALGELRCPRAVEPLIGALRRGGLVGYCAAISLGDIGDPRALQPLTAALESDDEQIRRAAEVGLARLRERMAGRQSYRRNEERDGR
jgi:HEAT repeat protein